MKEEIQKSITHLEKERIHYQPHKYLRRYIKDTRDVYKERQLLKSISFDDKSIEYLVRIILTDVLNKKRFRMAECFKVLKTIIKKRRSSKSFDRPLVNNLFYLYQENIFSHNEEMQWAVSVFIKAQPLNNEHIQWLIDHFEESDHIANRLLRYPTPHKLITEWATVVYKNEMMTHRLSEVVGILIDGDLPNFIKVDIDTLMWAIYYSKCSVKNKEKLILKYLNYDDYSSALQVAHKLGLGSVSNELLGYYKGKLRECRINSVTHS
ncbi:MAG: hypothetical protein M0Z41_10635 [Peptococcaceae bacterium]|jgi:hypothetical protein|nr:hypothetical protein [Peptococcaceae bacterium]